MNTFRAMRTLLRRSTLSLVALSCLALPSVRAQQNPSYSQRLNAPDDGWHVSVSPYLWLSGIDGNVSIAGQTAAVHQDFSEIFSNLKVGVMGLAEARRGRVGILTDALFVRVGDQKAIPVPTTPLILNVDLTTTTFTLTPEVAFRFFESRHFAADMLGGLRYYHLGATSALTLNPLGERTLKGSDNWADVTGGARLIVPITSRLGAFALGDAGVGGSAQSWQVLYGAGYTLTRRITAQVGYRRFYFDRQSETSFAADATQQGLLIGATMHLR